MARKATALVACALLLLAVAFLSHDAGVEAWCVQYMAPNPKVCRGSRHPPNPKCSAECANFGQGGFVGKCNTNGDCLCIKCADDELLAAPAPAL